jgi:hypothetical protein
VQQQKDNTYQKCKFRKDDIWAFLWELVRGRCIDEHLKSRVSVPNNGRAAMLLINLAREFGRIEQRVLQQYGRTLPHEYIDKAADTAVMRFMCAVDSIMIRDRCDRDDEGAARERM